MCGRYSAYIDLVHAAASLSAQLAEGAQAFTPSANLAPTQPAPLLVDRGGRRLGLARFGFSIEGPRGPTLLLNARSETAASKPSFREAVASRRAIALADGYYEWKPEGGVKLPHLVRPRDGGLLYLAAAYVLDRSPDPAHRNPRFVLLTQAADATVSRLHDRMPVFVAPERIDEYLDRRATDAARLIAGFVGQVPTPLRAHPVSRAVSKTIETGVDLHTPTGPDLF